jgi:hypothetical protein
VVLSDGDGVSDGSTEAVGDGVTDGSGVGDGVGEGGAGCGITPPGNNALAIAVRTWPPNPL